MTESNELFRKMLADFDEAKRQLADERNANTVLTSMLMKAEAMHEASEARCGKLQPLADSVSGLKESLTAAINEANGEKQRCAKATAECVTATAQEKAAIIRATKAEATCLQMEAELKALRSKPAPVFAAPIIASQAVGKPEKKKTVRAMVRERDPNGRAVVLDIVVQ